MHLHEFLSSLSCKTDFIDIYLGNTLIKTKSFLYNETGFHKNQSQKIYLGIAFHEKNAAARFVQCDE